MQKVLRIFGSLKLAVLVLVLLAIILTAATIIESRTSSQFVQDTIYHAYWFLGLIGLLALNVLASALVRFPWKVNQIGFVITHAGVLVILIGAIVGLIGGIEGTIALEEMREAKSTFKSGEDILRVSSAGSGVANEFVVPQSVWLGIRSNLKLVREGLPGLDCSVFRFFPDTEEVFDVVESGDEFRPAILVEFERLNNTDIKPATFRSWLISGMPGRDSVVIGSHKIILHSFNSREDLDKIIRADFSEKTKSAGLGTLVVRIGEKNVRIPVSESGLARTILTNGLSVQVVSYFADFRMDMESRRPISVSDAPNNPAILFEVGIGTNKWTGFAFANFPEMTIIRNDANEIVKQSETLKIVYDYPQIERLSGADAGILLVVGPGRELYYRLNNRGESEVKKINYSGSPIMIPLNDGNLVISKFVERPAFIKKIVGLNDVQMSEGSNPGIELRLVWRGKTGTVVLARGRSSEVIMDGERFNLELRSREVALPFSLRLIKFITERYEGTTIPATFESVVHVSDKITSQEFETRIWMNHPLSLHGYRVSQASYIEGQDGSPNISILQVLRDPGAPFKWIGSFMLTVGVGLNIWLRWSRRRNASNS